MLYRPDDVIRQLSAISKRRKVDTAEAARQLLEVDPNFAPAIVVSSIAHQVKGEPGKAEEILWSGLDRCPCSVELHLALAGLLQELRPADPTSLRLVEIAFWKLSQVEKVRADIAKLTGPAMKGIGSARDPDTYGLAALQYEEELGGYETPLKEDKRLAPHRLLNDLQREASSEVQGKTLRKVMRQAEKLVPLLHAAVREWANAIRESHPLSPAAAAIFVAVLGEIGGPDLLGDLLELTREPDEQLFPYFHWALYRLGQRFPAEALANLSASARDSGSSLRCAVAEHLNLLPALDGVTPALAALIDDFPRIASEEEAAYLLAIVTDAMANRDAIEQAHSLLARNQKLLDRDARQWLEEMINGDEEFVPRLESDGINEYTLEDVCIERVFEIGDDFDDEETDEEYSESEPFESEEEVEMFEDDLEFNLESPFSPKVGRNEPCWCGSGKKYKKCHLPEDEQAHFSNIPADTPPEPAPLPLRILKGLEKWHTKADRANSRQLFFGKVEESARDENQLDAFVQFLLHDFRDAATGLTLTEHFLQDSGLTLTGKDRATAEALRDSRFGLYEITGIEKGRGARMTDVFDGKEFFVEDVATSRNSKAGDYGLLRVQHLKDRYVLAGNGLVVAPAHLDVIKQFVGISAREARQSEAEFVRANTHLVRRLVLDLNAMAGSAPLR